MGLRDEHLSQLLTGLRRDPDPGLAHIVADRGVGHHQLVLIDQPFPDPQRGMTLLPRRVQILPQHRINQRLHRVQHRRRPDRHLPRRRFGRGQRLADRSPVHPMPQRQLADRHIRIIPTVPTDRFEHPDTTPNRHSSPPFRRQRRTASGGARSDRHNQPRVSQPGPNQAVTVGPNQSVISSLLSAEVHVVYGGFDQEPADVAVSGTGDLARTLLAPECSEGSVRSGRRCRCRRIGPHPSPISTASANPPRVEIPRRYPSLCAIRVPPESAASCSIRASSRSRRAEVAST